LDSLFNVVFMLEDLETRSGWYHKSGWREQKLEYERMLSEYGDSSDPEWARWLREFEQFVILGKGLFQITDTELANPVKEIKTWPNPGQMPDYGINPANRPPDRQFLHYLGDWFYRDHSAQAHMSFAGTVKLGGILIRPDLPQDEQERLTREILPRFLSKHYSTGAILLLCLISEVEHYFGFGADIPLRILELWHKFIPDLPDAKKLFEKRYAAFWPALLIAGPGESRS
jgi:hypothetical protein